MNSATQEAIETIRAVKELQDVLGIVRVPIATLKQIEKLLSDYKQFGDTLSYDIRVQEQLAAIRAAMGGKV